MRWLGSAMVLVGCAWAGWALAAAMNRRTKQLGAMKRALEMLETEIVYGGTPLQTACRRIGRALPEVAPFFEGLGNDIASGETAGTAWDKALTSPNRHLLPVESVTALRRLGPVLGLSDSSDQTRHLRMVHGEVGALYEEERSRLPQRMRLCRALGVASGLVIVLMLI